VTGFVQLGNFIYPKFKGALLIGGSGLSLGGGTVRAALLSAGYAANVAVDQFLSDVPSAAIVATSDALASKILSPTGQFSSAAPTLLGVTGSEVYSMILYIDTGDAGTSRLVFYQDSNITGIPFTPSGGNAQLSEAGGFWFTL
jgi:hypothetical protein